MRKSSRYFAADGARCFFCKTGLAAACLAALVQMAGCESSSTDAVPAEEAETAAANVVRIVKPFRTTVRHPIEQPGFNIAPFQETPLYAKITGFVRKWNVDIGDSVHQGDLLAVLSVPELQVELEQKEAAIRHAAAQIEQARSSVVTTQAQLDRAKAQYERLARAGKGGVLDQESVDEIRLGYEAAKAVLMKAKADVTAAEAHLEVAKANRNYARTMLNYAQIRAPYDGMVTQRNVNSGDFVHSAGTGASAQPLFVVDQIDPVRVFVNVPGSDALWIKNGDPVVLQLQGAGGELIRCQVTRNARSLDPRARTLRTEIDLPNPQGKLLPGMYVQASITVEHENTWTLPAAAILTEGDQTFCYRIEAGRALRTPLQIGLQGSGLVEVLMKQARISLSSDAERWTAITGNEEIVGGNAASMRDGQVVHVLMSDK